MRKEFVKIINQILTKNRNIFLILCDIGVFSFRNIFKRFKKNILNIGILEQSTVSFAAGLAKLKFIPVIHSISPFLVERALEQLKVDFGYQKIGGNIVTIGSSYDYAKMGSTHHCPADINLIGNIPDSEIIVPGTAQEFKSLFFSRYANNKLSYFRLSDFENDKSNKVKFGKGNILKKKGKITLVAFGPTLNLVKNILKDLDVGLIYYTTVKPLDTNPIKIQKKYNNKFLIIEPFYSGFVTQNLIDNKVFDNVIVRKVSIPIKFIRNYGSKNQLDLKSGLSEKNIKKEINILINAK